MSLLRNIKIRISHITPWKKFCLFNGFVFFVLFILILIFRNPPESKSQCLGFSYCLECCAKCRAYNIEGYPPGLGGCSTTCASDYNYTAYPTYSCAPCNQYDDCSHTCRMRVGMY